MPAPRWSAAAPVGGLRLTWWARSGGAPPCPRCWPTGGRDGAGGGSSWPAGRGRRNRAVAIRPIVKWGEAVLHTPAEPVTEIDGAIASLFQDMVETMYAAPGI